VRRCLVSAFVVVMSTWGPNKCSTFTFTLANSVSYAFLLSLTEKSHKLSRIRVQTRRKATKVVADVSIVCGLARIIDVTDGVADVQEVSIVNEQDRMSTTKSLWVILGQLGLCAAVAELSSRYKRCQNSCKPYCPCMQCSLSSGGANRGW